MDILDKSNLFEITPENLFRESPIPIAIVSIDGMFLKVNNSFQEFVGYSSSELEGKKHYKDITHPEDLSADMQMVQSTLNGAIDGDCYEILKRYITKTGRIVWGKLNVKLVKFNNAPAYFISHITPISAEPIIVKAKIDSNKLITFMKNNWKFLFMTFSSLFITCGGWVWSQISEWQQIKYELKTYLEQQHKKEAQEKPAPPQNKEIKLD